MIKEAVKKLVNHENITRHEAYEAMEEIMSGKATDAQISAFITALSMKGETMDEICGCAAVMDKHADHVSLDFEAVDIVGTGGDGTGTFNISTCAAFVTAGAGLPVAKHGNRSVSSRCGSADVLEALGAVIALTPSEAEACFSQTGICFMFAPGYHKSMKYAAGPRKELGIRSIFNILGPMTNPARAPYRLMGVFTPKLLRPLAEVLGHMGIKGALAVCGEGGLDEMALSGPTSVCELKNGDIKEYTVTPIEAGLASAPLAAIQGGDAWENAVILNRILQGEKGPKRDIVLFNAAGALYAGGLASSLEEGTVRAASSIDSGAAYKKLNEYKEATLRITEARQ